MASDDTQEIVKTTPEKQEIQDIIEDVIEEIKDIIQEIKDVKTIEDVIEVIEHVSHDVEIVVQKTKIENENENSSIFNCFFNWIGTIF
jgi:gas vesicle protein